jgi:hypothetical protein
VEPLGYLNFLKHMANARVVFTDFGGIQEETTVLAMPCITLCPNTERPITPEVGPNYLVGKDPDRILVVYSNIMQEGYVFRKLLRSGMAGQLPGPFPSWQVDWRLCVKHTLLFAEAVAGRGSRRIRGHG